MIGILTLNPDTFTNPTLYATIQQLNQKNITVGLFCGYQQSPIPAELTLTKYFNAPKGLNLPRRPFNIFKYLRSFLNVITQIRKNRIKHIIAVDPYGLIMSGWVKIFLKDIRIHYFSFEIFFLEELKNNPALLRLKQREIHFTKGVHSIIVQDPRRQDLLAIENKVSSDFKNWFLIPVAPSARQPLSTKTYQKADFGLRSTDTVYIHSGSVAEWSGLNAIIKAIEDGLPQNTYILVHSRSKFDRQNEGHKKLFELREKGLPVILHDELFDSYADYTAFLKCFDFGITIYKTDNGQFTGRNLQEIGLSSGKFATYMSLGMPTLLSECATYTAILKQHAIGQLITETHDLSYHINNHSLEGINRAECLKFFDAILNPAPPLTSFLTHIGIN